MKATQLNYSTYRDRVLAGWLGKSIGGAMGAPVENQKQRHQFTEETIWAARVPPNDDMDIQIVWLEALQERGLYLTSQDLAEVWQDRCWYNFCEYGVFLHNVQRGIAAPRSGTWNNDFFAESEGCPIRSEIWGFVAPGNPQLAADLAQQDGQIDHGVLSTDIERFLSAAAAQALVSDDLETVLAAGLSVVQPDGRISQALERARAICAKYPEPYDAWRLIVRQYGDRDASKALLNHAFVLMSLFLGGGDFKRTMIIAVNCGWDSDCTAATAGALLGAMMGTARLPQEWVKRIGDRLVCGVKLRHQNARFEELADETCLLGVEMAAARNTAICFSEAPLVTVRPAPDPALSLRVEYSEEPVLYRERPTRIQVVLQNHSAQALRGTLLIQPPTGALVNQDSWSLELPAGASHSVFVEVRRTDPAAALPDKNLFIAQWKGSHTEAKLTFGLGGARQWLAYGPYWEMWDRTRFPVCPYNNPERTCIPGEAQCTGDNYNQYARLDCAYLDENRLLREDLPEELPFRFERGEDWIDEHHLGGFRGQACYYLVREFRAREAGEVNIFFGRSGPYRAWLDGQLVGEDQRMRCWAPHEDEGLRVRLTGQRQRLVIKLVSLSDVFRFSVLFIGPGDTEMRRGISYILDHLEDLPSAHSVLL